MELRALVGIPGSGKSTIAQDWYDRNTIDTIISSDAIRAELTGDAGNVTKDQKVWAVYFLRVEAALRRNERVVLDSTNLKPGNRGQIVKVAAEYGIRPSAHIVDVPYEIATLRNNMRDRNVPDFVMKRMWSDYTTFCLPQNLVNEGFDVVLYHVGLRPREEVII